MGSKIKEINMAHYAVRIATDNGKSLRGSGVLFIRNIGEDAFVFTAAHVVDDIMSDSKMEIEKLYLSCTDGNGIYKIISVSSKRALDTMSENNVESLIYVHPRYYKDGLKNDAAIITVPWNEWMATLDNLKLDKYVSDTELKGWGFPASMNKEWDSDSQNEVAGKKDLRGRSVAQGEKRFSVYYDMNNFPLKIKRKDTMVGFSGSGLFEGREGSHVLIGVISDECGDETAGNMLWASEITLFYEILEHYGLKIAIPDSFKAYRDILMDSIPKIRKKARRFFTDKSEQLLEVEKLTPKEILSDEEKLYKGLVCEGRWESCSDYWVGQLEKAFILYFLAGVPKEGLEHPVLQMPKPYEDDRVYVAFLCTEEAAEDVICKLIQKDYFSRTGQLFDKTIFLLHGKSNNKSFTCLFSRKICRDIVVNIADEYEDESTKVLSEKMEHFIVEGQEQYSFDIIKGAVAQCNLAIIGMGKLMEIIEQGDGTEEKMKTQMEGVLANVWEI